MKIVLIFFVVFVVTCENSSLLLASNSHFIYHIDSSKIDQHLLTFLDSEGYRHSRESFINCIAFEMSAKMRIAEAYNITQSHGLNDADARGDKSGQQPTNSDEKSRYRECLDTCAFRLKNIILVAKNVSDAFLDYFDPNFKKRFRKDFIDKQEKCLNVITGEYCSKREISELFRWFVEPNENFLPFMDIITEQIIKKDPEFMKLFDEKMKSYAPEWGI